MKPVIVRCLLSFSASAVASVCLSVLLRLDSGTSFLVGLVLGSASQIWALATADIR